MENAYLYRYNKYENPSKTRKSHGVAVYVFISNEFIRKILVDEIFDKLPAKYKYTAQLIYIERYAPEEVAKVLGVHRSTIYRRMHKIEQKVEKYSK